MAFNRQPENFNPSVNGKAEFEKAKEELKEIQQALEEERNRHLRTLADFDNFRKRVERDVLSRSTQGKKDLITDLLTVLDNLELAIRQVGDVQVKQGLRLVYQQFINLLQQHGAVPLESTGKPFDPEEHEGIGYVECTDYPEGHVAEELCRGYRFGRELLRPARVRVAKKPAGSGAMFH